MATAPTRVLRAEEPHRDAQQQFMEQAIKVYRYIRQLGIVPDQIDPLCHHLSAAAKDTKRWDSAREAEPNGDDLRAIMGPDDDEDEEDPPAVPIARFPMSQPHGEPVLKQMATLEAMARRGSPQPSRKSPLGRLFHRLCNRQKGDRAWAAAARKYWPKRH